MDDEIVYPEGTGRSAVESKSCRKILALRDTVHGVIPESSKIEDIERSMSAFCHRSKTIKTCTVPQSCLLLSQCSCPTPLKPVLDRPSAYRARTAARPWGLLLADTERIKA